MSSRRVVVMDVVGLAPNYLQMKEHAPHLHDLAVSGTMHTITPVFPAVTLPVQASLLTGTYPETHGVVSNGFYFPETYHVAFWEQAASLVQAERLWEWLKRRHPSITAALLFFQNSLYASCDIVMTPRPLHTEDGMIPWCYSKPVGLYEDLSEKIGVFNLMHYWGPLASIESSRWIAKAAVEVLERFRPHLLFVYLPHLDYGLQKYGPKDPKILEELAAVDAEVGRIVQGVSALGLEQDTTFIVVSEYTFSDVIGDVSLNRVLRDAGFLKVRTIKGREYVDLEMSEAFAMVDHQVAHIYIKAGYEKRVRSCLEKTDGVDILMDREEQKKHRVSHPRAGDLIAVSSRDRWFSYYWWDDPTKEPDFARRVDIHRKPGYDPLELFLEPGTLRISHDTSKIHGSHGYPPLTLQDRVPLLVSGPGAEIVQGVRDLSVTDIAKVIERIMGL